MLRGIGSLQAYGDSRSNTQLRHTHVLMGLGQRVTYLRRVAAAYVGGGTSQLTFWHETPTVNERFRTGRLGPYYMTFEEKANYEGPFDEQGIPMLDYRGSLGRQYNPIAIAQYALGNYNAWEESRGEEQKTRFLRASDWLVSHLEENPHGSPVWNHHFDWEYRTRLRAPWYSGLAQGQGISALLRAHLVTENDTYLEAAHRAFRPLSEPTAEGGVLFIDERGHTWIEEYIVHPPTHILNGFIWASWGVYDYWLATGSLAAEQLFQESIKTLKENLHTYDTGFWSLYEHSGTRTKMIASPFYHRLHVVQLEILARLTGEQLFRQTSKKWAQYGRSRVNRNRAIAQKLAFKLLHY